MSPAQPCPDAEAYEQLLRGGLPPPERDRLLRHLEACPPCADAVDTLLEAGTLVGVVRGQEVPRARPEAHVVEGLMRDLAGRPPSPREAGTGATTREDTGGRHGGADETFPEQYDFLAPPEQPDEIGRLGPYRVLKVLGAGGMGVVFQAEDDQLKRLVALKVMKPAAAAIPSAGQRFLREARSAAALKHDHVVTLYHVGEDRGVPFLAMELLEGEPLDRRLGRGELPLAEVLRVGREVALGLAAAHARGLIHRDIKPGNVWLEELPGEPGGSSPRYRVKILDFGLARAADDQHMTQEGVVLGTPAYMAPEQARGRGVEARSDLFSLGVVLYRLTTGRLPFCGPDSVSTILSAATDQPPSPREINPAVPRALSDLVVRLLAKAPDARPPSARAVAEALQAIEPDAAVTPPEKAPPPRRRASRPRRVALAAALLLLALGPVGYYYGGSLIRIATNKGVLVIETDDKDIEVTVKADSATLYDKVKDRRFVLTAGKDYDVEVREVGDGGLRFATKTFTITRGGEEKFKARLEVAEAKPEPPAAAVRDVKPTDTERVLLDLLNQERAKAGAAPLKLHELLVRAARRHADDMARWQKLSHESEDRNPFERLKDVGYDYRSAGENVATGQKTPGEVVQDWLAAPGHKRNLLNPDFLEVGLGLARSDKGEPYYAALFAAPKTAPAVDPVRQAAELLLDLGVGASITLEITNQIDHARGVAQYATKTIFEKAALPAGPLRVIGVEIYDKEIKPAHADAMARLTELTSILCHRDKLPPDFVATITACRKLRSLNLAGCGLRDADVAPVAKFPALTNVGFSDTGIGPATVDVLVGMKNLKVVHLGEARIGVAEVKRLAALPLEELLIQRSKLTDADLDPLKRMFGLKHLGLEKTQVTADGVKMLAEALPQCKITWNGATVEPHLTPDRRAAEWVLKGGGGVAYRDGEEDVTVWKAADLPAGPFRISKAIWLWGAQFRDVEGLKNLTGLPGLSQVVIETHEKLDERAFAFFKDMPELTMLLLSCTSEEEFSPSGLDNLLACKNLTVLRLEGWHLSDKDCEKIGQMTQLTNLGLDGRRLTAWGFAHLAPLHGLGGLSIYSPISAADLEQVKRLKNLTSLHVHGITDEGLAHVGELRQMGELSLGEARLTDAGLKPLAGLSKLGALYIHGAPLNGSGLEHVKGLNLERLVLNGTTVGDDGLRAIKWMTGLHTLGLSNTKVTNAGLADLATLTNLEEIHLGGTAVTDAGLKQLKGLKKLRQLHLEQTGVTAAGVADLQAALPDCHIAHGAK